ncbi:MAG: phosphoribosylformylglycinamidine synthase [Cytophagales bacterium CG18_big_fil_WC_8_21_14_2_50_42_9]|nr:MAG: phosphoribosylformylglycinamidine synthase [Cytophagales bacterium CG18_big_fil_WC_8_21_14_2_50_42_9]
MRVLLLVGFVIAPLLSFCQALSPKRGLAYGKNSSLDLEVLSKGLSWWYNWAEAPEPAVINYYQRYGFDFVPMAWNSSFNEQTLRNYLSTHPNVKYILGFNEPNFKQQANLTPSQAAAQWPKLEKIADDFNLKIVGPAVNYCDVCVTENGKTYTDPILYLDDFFAACSTCRIDYIAIHSYMNSVTVLEWYVGLFKKYNKPIWLTEFAGWEYNGNLNTAAEQENFLVGAVDILETNPNIFRYAWFIGRTSGGPNTYPFIDLLKGNGELTALGKTYVNMPVHDPAFYAPVPGTIEAENYTQMKGILLEKTQDVTGFAQVGYIDKDDWLEYNIAVENSDTYKVDWRVASNAVASADILLDDTKQFTQTFTNTGGYQSWTTFNNTLYLTAGQHTLRIKANTGGFNLNYIQLTGSVVTGSSDLVVRNNQVEIFPNPSAGKIHLKSDLEIEKVEIYNPVGKKVKSMAFSPTIDLAGLSAGVYFLKGFDKTNQVSFVERVFLTR